jgi:hypothetical protein
MPYLPLAIVRVLVLLPRRYYTFFDDIYQWDPSGEPVMGKPAVLFFSHGGGGKVRQSFEYLAGRFFEQVGETVGSGRPIGAEAKKKCFALGKELAKKKD